ncbi:MAG TPA: hypothetical protein VGH96_05995 [Streptosporangiaceae bacterium]
MRTDRGALIAPGSSMPGRDAVLGMHLRWLEIVGRETTAVSAREPRLSLIPVPLAAQIGGRRAW